MRRTPHGATRRPAPTLALLSGADERTATMPKLSMDSGEGVDYGPVVDRLMDTDGYAIQFITFKVAMDGTPMLKGLPDDRCQCPHWGYVLRGRVTFRFADHDEVFEAGDAFSLPPGHIPVHDADSEYLQFSPV